MIIWHMAEFGRFIYRDFFFSLTTFISCLAVCSPPKPSESSTSPMKRFPISSVLPLLVCCFYFFCAIPACITVTCYSLGPFLIRSSLKSLSSSFTRASTPDKMLTCFVSWRHSVSVLCKTSKYLYWLKWKAVNFSLSAHGSCPVAT